MSAAPLRTSAAQDGVSRTEDAPAPRTTPGPRDAAAPSLPAPSATDRVRAGWARWTRGASPVLGPVGTTLKYVSLVVACLVAVVPLVTIFMASFKTQAEFRDRKSTRLNSSHVKSSYAVFCLKKKKTWMQDSYSRK